MKNNETKNLIARVFSDMANRKGFDKITVTDLVEECRISRQTFYYHFQDIFDVVEWSIGQEIEKAVESSLSAETREDAIRMFVEKTVTEYPLISNFLNSKHSRELEKHYTAGLRKYFEMLLKSKSHELDIKVSELEPFLSFFSYGIVGLLLDYYRKQKLSADEITRQICVMLDTLLMKRTDN